MTGPIQGKPGASVQQATTPAWLGETSDRSTLKGRVVSDESSSTQRPRSIPPSTGQSTVPLAGRNVETPSAESTHIRASVGLNAKNLTNAKAALSSSNTHYSNADSKISQLKTNLYTDAKTTADAHGRGAFGFSFGAGGLAARSFGQAAGLAVMPQAFQRQSQVISSSLGLLSPMVHAAAGPLAAPGREGTQFVARGNQPLAGDNPIGNAFTPFRKNLSLGNAAVATAGIVIGAAASAAFKKNHTDPTLALEVVKFVTNMVLYAPGMLAGQATMNNVFGLKADAGHSLEQPINNSDGKAIGKMVTHQDPSNMTKTTLPRTSMGINQQELGVIILDVGDKTHKVAILKDTRTGETELKLAEGPGVDLEIAKTTGEKLLAAGKTTLGTFNWQTANKVTSLASTTLAIGLASEYLMPKIVESLVEDGVIEVLAEPIAKINLAVISGLALGVDFIPKFTAAFMSSAPKAALSNLQNALSEPLKRAGEMFISALPGVGGAVAIASGRADGSQTKPLSVDSMDNLASVQAQMLAGLAASGLATVDGNDMKFNHSAIEKYVTGLVDQRSEPA